MQYFQLASHKIYIENYYDSFLILKEALPLLTSVIPKIGVVLFEKNLHFIDEVIGTETEICIKLNQKFSSKEIYQIIKTCEEEIDEILSEKKSKPSIYKLPVCFETGTDWNLIEENCDVSVEEYIEEIINAKFNLAMYGFLPGFLYLNGLPDHLHCKRKSIPTKTIAPNSLAIGSQYLGLYSIPSPAGWNIIGTSAFSVTNIPESPPNLLKVGDQIKLQRISLSQLKELNSSDQNLLSYNA